MRNVRPCLIALALVAFVIVGGCKSGNGDGRPKSPALTEAQMLDKAAQMNADGERLRADAVAKQRQGDAAGSKREMTAADKMTTDAKMLKDQALLRDSKPEK